MIDGVVFKPLVTHTDQRGFFREIIRVTDAVFEEGFGQWGHSLMHVGVAKAWHIHKIQIDWWYVASGLLKVALYDTRSGEALPNGVPDGDHVVTFAPGDRLTVTYVVAPAAQSPGRELELRTCELTSTAECAVAARIPNQGGTPVLAR